MDTPLFAVEDAHSVAQALHDDIGFAEQNLFLMTPDAALAANRPTNINLIKRLTGLSQQIGPHDTLFLYFEGRFLQGTDGKYYLGLQNADTSSDETLKLTCLPLDALMTKLKLTHAKQIILCVDASRVEPPMQAGSETFAKPLLLALKNFGDNTNIAALFACSEGEQSQLVPELKHSLFTRYLLEGLKDKAQANSQLSLDRLAHFVQDHVRQWSQEHAPQTHAQRPELRSFAVEDIVLASHGSKRIVEAPTTQPDETKPAGRVEGNSAQVEVITDPPGATIFVDNEEVKDKVTPAIITIDLSKAESKRVEIAAEAAERKTEVRSVEVTRGSKAKLEITMVAKPSRPTTGKGKEALTGANKAVHSVMPLAVRAYTGMAAAQTLRDHSKPLEGACFSPDGSIIATFGQDQKVCLYNAGGGALLHTLDCKATPRRVQFLSVGDVLIACVLVAAGKHNDLLRPQLWHVKTGLPLGGETSSSPEFLVARQTSDDKTIVSVCKDKTVCLWDVPSASLRHSFHIPYAANHLQTLLNGRLVVTVNGEKPLRYDVAPTADGSFHGLVTTSEMDIWDASTGKPLGALSKQAAEFVLFGFAPDGKTFLTAGKDKIVRFWDGETLQVKQTLGPTTSQAEGFAFSPDGKLLALGCDKQITLFDVSSGKPLKTWDKLAAPISLLAFSPDGKTLATAGIIQRHNINLLGNLLNVAFALGISMAANGFQAPKPGQSYNVVNPHSITQRWGDTQLYLWDVATQKPLQQTLRKKIAADALQFSPDSRFLATSGDELLLWNAETGELVQKFAKPGTQLVLDSAADDSWKQRLEPFISAIRQNRDCTSSWILFSSTGDAIVSGEQTQINGMWDTKTGKVPEEWDTKTDKESKETLHPYNWNNLIWHDPSPHALHLRKELAFRAQNGIKQPLHVWLEDKTEGKERRKQYEQAMKDVTDVALSPDGQTWAMGSKDGSIRLYDINSREVKETLTGHHKSILALTFAANGASLLSCSEDQSVIVWHVL